MKGQRKGSAMSDQNLFPVPQDWAQNSRITADRYDALYAQALKEPEQFWLEQAKRLDWYRAPTKAGNASFDKENFGIKWFEDGQLNASVNQFHLLAHKPLQQIRYFGNHIWQLQDLRPQRLLAGKSQ